VEVGELTRKRKMM